MVQPCSFFASELNEGGWSEPLFGSLTPWKSHVTHFTGGLMGPKALLHGWDCTRSFFFNYKAIWQHEIFLRKCKFVFFRLTRDDELNKGTVHEDALNSTRICYEETGTELTTGATAVGKEPTLNTCKHRCRNFDLGGWFC